MITETFNYDLQGAHFSAPAAYPYIGGNSTNGYDLQVSLPNSFDRTWIAGDLTTPARAVGVFFPGGTILHAYNAAGTEIGSVQYGGGPGPFFIGLVSIGAPVSRIIVNRGTNAEQVNSFVFRSVPEPCTAALFAAGVAWLAARRRR